MPFYSPLRYPGGKARVSDYFFKVFTKNSLDGGVYIEPFAGGASVALSLLFNEHASKIIINDADRSIYSFWYSIIKKTDKFCKKIRDTKIDLETWKLQKEIQKRKTKANLFELGFSTFFLNRTNRGGILKAGIIGGKAQAGEWKIDARFNKNELIKRIEKIALYSSKIKIHNLDVIELIKELKNQLPKKSLFFFDPPYFVKGQQLYLNNLEPNDHRRFAKEISKLKDVNWIITYDNVKDVANLYQKYRRKKYSLHYSIGTHYDGKEIMIFSDSLTIPNFNFNKH